MTESGISLAAVGAVTLIGLPYNLKFLWAPVFDRFVPPFLGRRRGWLLVSQILLALVIFALSTFDPGQSIFPLVALAVLTAFLSASQDTVADAYRRESLESSELGLGSSIFVNGYRLGMLVSGAGALRLADSLSWPQVYMIMAACMIVGALTSLFAVEPVIDEPRPKTLREAVVEPFVDYFKRGPVALWILAFILFYKLGDNIASAMTIPYYLHIGFSKTDIGNVAKVFGMGAVILGSFVGGVVVLKRGIVQSLFLFGIFQALGAAAFSLLIQTGPKIEALMFVIGLENFAIGMGTSALVAFMGLVTSKRFTATQFALLTSLAALPRTVLSAPSGWLAEHLGWTAFFIACGLVAIPGLFLILKIKDLQELN